MIDCAAGVGWRQDDGVDCPVVVAEEVMMAVVSEGEAVVDGVGEGVGLTVGVSDGSARDLLGAPLPSVCTQSTRRQ